MYTCTSSPTIKCVKLKTDKYLPAHFTQTTGADFSVMNIPVPDTEDQVDLYIFDTSGHELYSKLRPRFWYVFVVIVIENIVRGVGLHL